ncbi:hypothetical protein [Shimia sediminis]|uniref:hypothetical protein n=1 Tax=Shimia sediminis TaxID=2497945 RepID=UPI000F8D3BF1|nr:hypothetical protein [Shimia sediminis]
MSDPVANVEIEDVLTSIRRLVSEGGRPSGAMRNQRADLPNVAAPIVAPAQQAELAGRDASLDRLVLTPAQRIPEPADTSSTADADEAFEEMSGTAPALGDSEADGPELLLHPINAGNDEYLDEEDVAALDAVEGARALEQDLDLSPEYDPDEGIALSDAQAMESRIVRWENLNPDDSSDVLEPDSPGDNDYAGTDVRGLSWIDTAESPVDMQNEVADLDEASFAEDVEVEAPVADGFEMPAFLRSRAVEMPEAEDIADDAEIVDASETEPDADPDFEEQALDPIEMMASQIEAEASAYVEEVVEESIAPELEDFDSDDTVMLDETMLRELVSDIVRQELQGALGERITRNVRKLVRREIHRALAAHDLE